MESTAVSWLLVGVLRLIICVRASVVFSYDLTKMNWLETYLDDGVFSAKYGERLSKVRFNNLPHLPKFS